MPTPTMRFCLAELDTDDLHDPLRRERPRRYVTSARPVSVTALQVLLTKARATVIGRKLSRRRWAPARQRPSFAGVRQAVLAAVEPHTGSATADLNGARARLCWWSPAAL